MTLIRKTRYAQNSLIGRAWKHISGLLVACVALSLVACSSSSHGSNSNGAVSLGVLPNGSTVYISQNIYTTNSGESTTGTLSISGGTVGKSYAFSFGIAPVTTPAPSVSSNPNPCTLTSGSSNTCQISFNSGSASAGTYTITVYYTQSDSASTTFNSQIRNLPGTALPETINFIINGSSPTTESGTLVIMPLSVESIESGATTTATVSLSGSQGITSSNPVVVSVFSNNSVIMSVNPESCSLTTAENSCPITLTGESAGTATFSVSASEYIESTSSDLIINPTAATTTAAIMVIPTNQLTGVGVGTPIVIAFSAPIESATVTASTFKLGTSVGGSQITAESIIVSADNESATLIFTPNTILSLDTAYYVTVTDGVLDTNGNPISAVNGMFRTQSESYLIYVATNNGNGWSGNLLESAIQNGADPAEITNGISGADYLCQADSQCTFGGRCKAMLVDGINRDATINGAGIDWVLRAYSSYQNKSGQAVGITGINPVGYNTAATSPAD